MLLHAPGRKSISCFGAVNLHTGKFIFLLSPKFNAVTFEEFLKKLVRHRSHGKKMVIVLDNVRYHYAKRLAPFLKKHKEHLELFFLPPYSPQLAPIERVWKLTRRMATHNRYFASIEDLQVAVETCFAPWRRPNAVLKRLCTLLKALCIIRSTNGSQAGNFIPVQSCAITSRARAGVNETWLGGPGLHPKPLTRFAMGKPR